jgi:LytS/YehU family sensor histidine kinase
MRILRISALWLGLVVFFVLINNRFEAVSIFIQALNGTLFVIGFYFSYTCLVKPLLYKKKTVLFLLLYLLTICILSAASIFGNYGLYIWGKQTFLVKHYWDEVAYLTSNFLLLFAIISALLSFRFLRDTMRTRLQLENMEKEKISTELDFLKAQINPHFLFNSLNNIMFQIDRSNTEARDTLLIFSEMLRYQLYECNSELIEIERELQYIRNYVDIQMLRRSEKYSCHVVIADTVKNFQLAPLLLIPFIENAFKHVSSHPNRKNAITIVMDYKNGRFDFTVSNDKESNLPTTVKEHGGIGLSNVKRRLDLLYAKKHRLEINDTQEQFVINLEMQVSA